MSQTDEQLLQQESRGQRARDVIESDVYRDAFDQVKTEIIEQWQNAPARDQEGRERLWVMLKLLEKVDSCLSQTMDSGTIARQELAYRKTLPERAKEWLGR